MRRSLSAFAGKIELIAIWVVRILFAPNHFGVNIFKRIYYAVFGGFMVDQVAMYGLDRKKKKKYLSEFDWHRSRRINEPYSAMLNNKLVFAEAVKRFCSTPELYAVKQHGRIVGLNGRRIKDSADLLALLYKTGAIVIKPVCAGKGNDIYIARIIGERLIINGEPSDKGRLIKIIESGREYLVCAYADQAEYLMKIYPACANTLRMITLYNEALGGFELCYAVQRIGTSKTGSVDNGSRGGLVANVDIKTGRLSEARTLHSLEVFERHPDSGAQIQGTVIPGWDNIKKGVLEVSDNFPYLDFIAWDILPTDEGFTVIEANTSSGVNIIQLWSPERDGKLGEFYRRHGAIK